MIINIRGAFGAGKSTIARVALGRSNLGPNPNRVLLAEDAVFKPTKQDPNRVETKAIRGTLGQFGRVVALGTYREENPCGGVDEFSWKGAHDTICEAVKAAAIAYPVTIFEGQVVSGIFQRYVDLARDIYEATGVATDVVFVQPGEKECLRRVSARSGKDINDLRLITSVREKYRAVENCYNKMEALKAPYLKPISFDDTGLAQQYVMDLVRQGVQHA